MKSWPKPPLTAPQRELLDAIARGVRVRWVEPYYPRAGYYRRWDTGRHCTAAALVLLALGLVERCNQRGAPGSGKHDLRVVGAGGAMDGAIEGLRSALKAPAADGRVGRKARAKTKEK